MLHSQICVYSHLSFDLVCNCTTSEICFVFCLNAQLDLYHSNWCMEFSDIM